MVTDPNVDLAPRVGDRGTKTPRRGRGESHDDHSDLVPIPKSEDPERCGTTDVMYTLHVMENLHLLIEPDHKVLTNRVLVIGSNQRTKQ